MTVVLIENLKASGQTITVSEAIEGRVVFRRLAPGESLRVAVSRFKSLSIEQAAAAGSANAAPTDAARRPRDPADVPVGATAEASLASTSRFAPNSRLENTGRAANSTP